MIVFSSDHGEMNGDHGMVYKMKVWRLPLAAPQARGKALVNLLPLVDHLLNEIGIEDGDVITRFDGVDHLQGVPMVGCCNDDGVDVFAQEQRAVVVVGGSLLAHAPQPGDGQRCQELGLGPGRDHDQPIGLLEVGRDRARSVARVRLENKSGSGFLTGDNVFVTNNHVIENPGGPITVRFDDGREEQGEAVSRLTGAVAARKTIDTATMHALMGEANDSGEYDLPRREGSDHITPIDGMTATVMTRLDQVEETTPEAVIVDMQVGSMGGMAVIRAIRGEVEKYRSWCELAV